MRFSIDHTKAIASERYRRRVAARIAPGFEVMGVVHEDDGSCCHQEAWWRTFDRIRGLAAIPVEDVLNTASPRVARFLSVEPGDQN